LTLAAAAAITERPTADDPVNETMSTSGWFTSACPASGPLPVTTLTTPSGMPASLAASASSSAVSGVSSLGLSTIVLPAATAGRIFQPAIWSG
jgi:hypothetical protein